MEEDELFFELFNCLKVLGGTKKVRFPDFGSQSKYKIFKLNEYEEKFNLLINRKGHLDPNKLTYIMSSKSLGGLLVRLDMAGPPHTGIDGIDIPTPHVHIFDEEHNYGSIVEPLSELSNHDIVDELYDSLIAFLLYNNVETKNIEFGII
ncbi:DUF6978 family protein [Carnobacterium maltaromaticum]|uniref:DUF6978 family protein n=1 Tax=Carnobacterium maltaromaticum TaxID=2751 RepID=UPI00165BF569|nr:hypothetical protein [Carnobacterium maltaromaticum]MBC9808209.1 hypothetical protein [Carnobacterium maltaromaticum]